jgi:hypothetical protein
MASVPLFDDPDLLMPNSYLYSSGGFPRRQVYPDLGQNQRLGSPLTLAPRGGCFGLSSPAGLDGGLENYR